MKSYLAKLGEFKFEISQTAYHTLKRSLSLDFSKFSRIGRFAGWQNMGRWNEEITLEGSLLLQKMGSLDPLLEMAKRKRPVTLVTGYGEIVGKVLILGVDLEQEQFLSHGIPLRQNFTLKMARFFDD